MPKLNPQQPDPPPAALVMVTGVAWLRLQRLLTALELGRIEIRYASGGTPTGIAWSADGQRAQLVLPPPQIEAEDLGQGGGEGGGGGEPAPDVKPFDVTVSLDEEAMDPETADRIVTLVPGVVNNLLPTNMFSTLSAPASGTRYVVLTVGTSSGEVTTAVLSIDSSAPDPLPVELSTPPVALALLIAVIIDGVAHQIVRGNISLTAKEAFRVDRESPAEPGELPYLSYWTWEQG